MGFCDVITKFSKTFKDTVIFRQGNKSVTYYELNHMINQIANSLIDMGFKSQTKIGALLNNSIEYIAIFFGAQKAGMVIVPINARYTLPEIEYIVDNADIKVIFSDISFKKDFVPLLEGNKDLKNIITLYSKESIDIDNVIAYEEFLKGASNEEPIVEKNDEDTVLILFTGGTTGYPKGAIITDTMLYNAAYLGPKHAMQLLLKKEIAESVLMPKTGRGMFFLIPTPLFHVSGLMPILTQIALRNLMVFPISKSFSPKEICEIIEREQITCIFMVPTMHQIFLDYEDLDKYDLTSLTVLSSGGAKMSDDLKIALLNKFDYVTLIDGYGQTETMGSATISFVRKKDILKVNKGYIGIPVHGTKIRLINEAGEDVKPGEVGEMIYSSPTLMKGYYKDDEKTDKVIKRDGKINWFHTGDLCTIDAHGGIYFVDRVSSTINTGGEKVYPAEVEEIMRRHPKVTQCAVVGKQDRTWGEIVTAYIQVKPNEKLTEEEIIEFIKDKLAGYKKPRIITFIEEVPLTKDHKINRALLKKMVKNLIDDTINQ